MKISLHGPTNSAEKLKLRFRTKDLDLPERGTRCISSWLEEAVDAQNRPCGKARENRSHEVGECGVNEEERGVLEWEISKIDKGDM